MNKYEKIFQMLVEAITEDVSKEIYVLPDGFKVDMTEVERAEVMYEGEG
jgi:hypothetical protein